MAPVTASPEESPAARTPCWVVSTGPGGAAQLTHQAEAALAAAEVVAGYGRYLDLLPPALLEGKTRVSTGMTGEAARCMAALEAAAAGRPSAVVSGGDAGVYGMAGLVIELAHEQGFMDVVEIEVVPGVTSITAAAALLGAPLMHDFATVSLSDRLTPWERIEHRLRCAAQGGFVLGLYNPRSRGRPELLDRAVAILGEYRPGGTCVGVVRQGYREEQSVQMATLATLATSTVDMLTVLIVGSEATRRLGNFLVTPRGYFEKYGPGGGA